ncbi:tRNA (5-methylaminomethyl-2-thiouridine)(34)-methyltransferase MnmD [Labrenzia sp. PHM005]|uniref:tRNA (5-methylaminomethyl-2-thiouridine)(34)-methyltransferase MnmD n=1 Tax=Labrenzia sp. PHM005 TaxID=2590016 RepID=UPI00113FD450|nr:tRNA (5-methylaminomethyl-2-thiouridine)(34)-methyltransferase MnmD [Labrenzia sp. PHM005]QDG78464.1 tRNA (5-methylaminomethyl-2-thiouridine)(34)-methyltransferase MnmD [Labrenzia sp. PHM005]
MTDEEQRKTDAAIRPPELEWLDGDVPRAEGFDDTYFSKAGGLAETRHVFLSGNGLPQRFIGRKKFTIAEFGFGTGLNFLATLLALKDVNPAPALTFVSFELRPMTADQLLRALAAFPELGDLPGQLAAVWAPNPGWSVMTVGGAQLVLGTGDARHLIGEFRDQAVAPLQDGPMPPVDAWFLDGFSPAKNPELWDAELLKSAADLTADGGTLATYTAAGWVRRNLQAAGFEIKKVKGYAGKREMVIGRKAA